VNEMAVPMNEMLKIARSQRRIDHPFSQQRGGVLQGDATTKAGAIGAVRDDADSTLNRRAVGHLLALSG